MNKNELKFYLEHKEHQYFMKYLKNEVRQFICAHHEVNKEIINENTTRYFNELNKYIYSFNEVFLTESIKVKNFSRSFVRVVIKL